MSPARDTQRAKVYDGDRFVRTIFDRAEQNGLRTVEVHGSHVTLPVERKFAKALKSGALKSLDADAQLAEAEQIGAISTEERKLLERVRAGTLEFIAVDDFDPAELQSAVRHPKPGLRSVA